MSISTSKARKLRVFIKEFNVMQTGSPTEYHHKHWFHPAIDFVTFTDFKVSEKIMAKVTHEYMWRRTINNYLKENK